MDVKDLDFSKTPDNADIASDQMEQGEMDGPTIRRIQLIGKPCAAYGL